MLTAAGGKKYAVNILTQKERKLRMKKIAIITNVTKDMGFVSAKAVVSFLKDRAEIFMSDDCAMPDESGIKYVPYDELWENADIMLVIGGDGTLLRVASRCAKARIPTLGINLGHVGFLTEIELSDIKEAIDKLLIGEYTIEKRMLLKIKINNENVSYHALNDLVVSKPEGTTLVSLDLYAGSELVNRYTADGLIIATPTGSTGYSISAGGPVVDPRMSLFVATPICAHMLAIRSAILPAEKNIVIRLNNEYAGSTAVISTDGEKRRFITSNDEVHISKSNYEFELIRIGASSFYDTLIRKLS